MMMKTNFLKTLTIAAFGIALLSSCNDQNDDPIGLTREETTTMDEEAIEATYFDDVEELAYDGFEYSEAMDGGRVVEDDSSALRCAAVSHSKENKTITIDFGDGCVGPGGRIRKGMIVITYSAKYYVPGARIRIELKDFYLNDMHIEGTRTMTNLMEDYQDVPSFHVVLEGGKVTWPDGSDATRMIDKIRTWERGVNPYLDKYYVTGSAEGVRRNGQAYEMTILEQLIYHRACRRKGIFMPVSGIKRITREGKEDIFIDFGEGQCDRTYVVKIGDHSEERTGK